MEKIIEVVCHKCLAPLGEVVEVVEQPWGMQIRLAETGHTEPRHIAKLFRECSCGDTLLNVIENSESDALMDKYVLKGDYEELEKEMLRLEKECTELHEKLGAAEAYNETMSKRLKNLAELCHEANMQSEEILNKIKER